MTWGGQGFHRPYERLRETIAEFKKFVPRCAQDAVTKNETFTYQVHENIRRSLITWFEAQTTDTNLCQKRSELGQGNI
jgi:hypothetical protein